MPACGLVLNRVWYFSSLFIDRRKKSPMLLYLTEADVCDLVDINDAITSVEHAFRQWGKTQNVNLPRQRLALPGGSLNLMAAALPTMDVFGYKAYFALPNGGHYIVALYSFFESRLVAMIEANWLSQLRTGAATGISTRYLARQDASKVGIIGSGKQARTQLLGVNAVRPIEEISVFSQTKEKRDRFAALMTEELGLPVTVAESAQACASDADIVITATKSAKPVLFGDWISEGTHIIAMGANMAQRHELDDEVVLKADIVAVDDRRQAQAEAGEFIDLADSGRLCWSDIAELGSIVQGTGPTRSSSHQITLFKSLGIAVEDVALAHFIFRRAKATSRGKQI
jgi:ornithine cyclodeaminase/alanine dehydrogenase